MKRFVSFWKCCCFAVLLNIYLYTHNDLGTNIASHIRRCGQFMCNEYFFVIFVAAVVVVLFLWFLVCRFCLFRFFSMIKLIYLMPCIVFRGTLITTAIAIASLFPVVVVGITVAIAVIVVVDVVASTESTRKYSFVPYFLMRHINWSLQCDSSI